MKLRTFVVAAAATTTLALGAAGAVSATTEPPADTATTGSEAPPAGGSAPGDAAAFCEAELAVEAAFGSGDPAMIGPAVEALIAAAPEELASTVEALIANAEAGPGDPAFDEPYGQVVDYMKANCGFNELDVALSEYAFGGIPEDVPAGGTILTAANTGEEVHEIVIVRVNDDVTLSAEELASLPEEEAFSMVTVVGGIFPVLPGETKSAPFNLTAGRHIALCFIPQGTTPELLEQMMAAEGSVPEGSAPMGSEPTGTDHAEMTADTASADTASADTATMGTAPADGSAPAGSAPAGEGPPHFTLGMIQEFNVS
jgi:hypothetical protein